MYLKKIYLIIPIIVLLTATTLSQTHKIVNASDKLSFGNDYTKFPEPASVKLSADGRFRSRFEGNTNYLSYLYENYGQEMINAYKARNYAPGKLLERMWDGEYAGKWLDAAVRTAVNRGDDELLAKVDEFATSLIKYQQPDGYMGIQLPTDRDLNDWEKSWDNWNQWNSMIGFLTHYEFLGKTASLEAAVKIANWIVNEYTPLEEHKEKFIDDNIIGGFTNAVVIGQMTRLFRHTGDRKYQDFVKQVIEIFPPIEQMLTTGEPFLFHPYMLNAVLMGVADYSSITKDTEMFEKVEEVWDVLADVHMFPTGSLGERENLDDKPIKDVPDGQLQETCATTEWIFFTMNLYEITGKVKYIEALEKTIYNALIGAQSDDGMKWCYWMPLRYSKHFLHGPTRCCFWSGPRGVARIPQMIYATKGNAVFVNLFESSKAKLTTESEDISISQESHFPDSGNSKITINSTNGWNGTLNIRVPEWAKDFTVMLQGKKLTGDLITDGYLKLNLTGSDEYQVNIKFDLPLRLEKLGENYVICRGPEVLALDTRDNIDTWLGAQDELISLPKEMKFLTIEPGKRYQWPGPVKSERRRYLVKVNDARTDELRGVVLTPYADAGNEGAAFRTVFPMETESDYPGDWKD